jgi:hypothetical protein
MRVCVVRRVGGARECVCVCRKCGSCGARLTRTLCTNYSMVQLLTGYNQSGSCPTGYMNRLYAVQFGFGKIWRNYGPVAVSVLQILG